MRKRLLIGAIAVLVIGLAAYFLSQPKEGTVEYHKQAYMGVHGPVLEWIVRHGPERISAAIMRRSRRRLDYHREALVRLGYLAELTFPVSNAPPETVLSRIQPSVYPRIVELVGPEADRDYFDYLLGTNSVRIRCVKADVELYKSVIPKADVTDAMWQRQFDLPK